MNDPYHHFLSQVSGIGDDVDSSSQDIAPAICGPPSFSAENDGRSSSFQGVGYFPTEVPVMFQPPKSQRQRRKSAPGLDHIKHRRTRSGCYTCRSRRVKCDETRPTCERCRKGKRDCIYPEPTPSKSSTTQSSKAIDSSQRISPTLSDDEDEDDVDIDTKLGTIPDEDEESLETVYQPQSRPARGLRRTSTASSLNLHRLMTRHRQASETPSVEGNKSSSPSVSIGTNNSLTSATHYSDLPLMTSSNQVEWAHLPLDFRFYLEYFYQNVTHYHYCVHQDSDDFFRTLLLSIAVQRNNEPLLHAIVGFSAYHYTLRDPNGRIEEVLKYYNKSVTLLLDFLKRKEKHNLATLLTILQLATIEDYLGDWINLMGHQKAALEILTHIFTPQTAIQTPTNRTIVLWYSRFDVYVGLMGNFNPGLPLEYFNWFGNNSRAQVENEPGNWEWKIEDSSNRLRLISVDMCLLFARRARNEIPLKVFVAEHGIISRRLQDWRQNLDPDLTDPAHLVTDLASRVSGDPNSIVDVFVPGSVPLYDLPLLSTTLLICEWHSMVMVHECQSITQTQAVNLTKLTQLTQHAYSICQIFEAVELWPSSPRGCLVTLHPCIEIAALFLPKDARHNMWVRRKFALLETLGCIFPITFRTRMAEAFQDQSCARWWLPDDEGFSPILRSIRAFADERNATAYSEKTQSLRDVKHIFGAMQLERDAAAMERP